MGKIIGNTTAVPNLQPDWEQIKNKPIPSVTTEDNGKFLRVVDGTWAAVFVPSAEEVTF